MKRLKFILRLTVFAVIAMFAHYVLPQHDIVKVTSTEVIRTDLSGFNGNFFAASDSAAPQTVTRDVRFINTQKQNTFLFGFIQRDTSRVMVYRNEDTDFWPPYFKFNSADLQAEAANLSRGDEWVVVTHYGWRNRWFSIYPNAVGLRIIDGPDATVVPWFNIFFFTMLLVLALVIRAMWRQFLERSVDPLLDAAGDQIDGMQAGLAEKRGRLARWFARK